VGYNAAVSGKDENAISGVALRQRAQAGQTELAPLFDGLKHMDHRVYRKIWNRIKQSWTSEKWIRVTDDPQTVKWVGLNTPVTDEYGQTQIQNDVATLDVDIVISDAPDAVTTQIEDFQVLGEMVKSGFPMPPEAVILASPLSHKDRILKMMQEAKQQQLPPQVQEQMQQMGEQLQKLTQENQALKQDQQIDMAKVQADHAAKMEAIRLDEQVEAEKARLARKKAEDEIALKIWIAEQEIAVKERVAAADAALKRERQAQE
jgi:hypothetical protein